MNACLRKIAEISPAKIWQVMCQPWRVPLAFTPPLPSIEAILRLFPSLEQKQVEQCRLELLLNHEYQRGINDVMVRTRGRTVDISEVIEFLYMAVRFIKPEKIIETGVFDGESSAAILLALHVNASGTLISIDLPATSTIEGSTHRMKESALPPGRKPGWAIPDFLRARHDLRLGDSKDILPKVLEEHPSIDIFFHDSLHTFEHQMFEYRAAWPHISPGGLLLSDDIHWSPAFHRFCRQQRRAYVRTGSFGAVTKPE